GSEMLIALDYDGTYTEDPAMWDQVVRAILGNGHEVLCVTMRNADTEKIPDPMPCPIIYTARMAKATHMLLLGHQVDVWIDDNPHWILRDSA
ncbi:MAG: hypothetical protein KGL35_05130, partial [Bradyrhizobium sp.]|nr:hypothetical protein [Bradyrhizobium sp.]